MWVAMSLKKQAELSVLGQSVDVPFSGMAKGCVGCLLVFDTEENASAYAGDGGHIVEVDWADPHA